MVSINQFEDNDLAKHSVSEHLKCPGISSQGINIPVYRFGIKSSTLRGLLCSPQEEQSTLDSLLLAQWEDRMWKGLFKYDVTASEVKVITGKRKFLAQLNEGLDMDSLPASRGDKILVSKRSFTFSCLKCNGELLFCVANGEKENADLILATSAPSDGIMILTNGTPIEYGHVFLVPCGFKSLPQFRDASSLEMIMRMAIEVNNCSFRVFYDNIMQGASHPYFQACYIPNPLPVELMQVLPFFSDQLGGTTISYLTDYPIKVLLFKSNNLRSLVKVLSEICSCLAEKGIPYSLLISDCGRKIFLFPQLQSLENSSISSAWECGGYFLFQSRCAFESATEESVLRRLGTASLDDEGFLMVKQLCYDIASKLVASTWDLW